MRPNPKPRSRSSHVSPNGPRALTGRPATFIAGRVVIVVWAVTGPLFGFSDTWQLVINTGTTIITFLMVFLIQSTQNRDAEAMQVKLDEIIRAIGNAKNELLDLEELEEEDLDEIRRDLHGHGEEGARRARSDAKGYATRARPEQ